MPKITLNKILTERTIQAMKKAAQELDIRKIKLFKSATAGYLTIFAIFDEDFDERKASLRAKALCYPVTQITGCKVGVISNKFNFDDALESQKSLDLDIEKMFSADGKLSQSFLKEFQRIFSCSPEEYEIDRAENDFPYECDMMRYKDYYQMVLKEQESAQKKQGQDKPQNDSVSNDRPAPLTPHKDASSVVAAATEKNSSGKNPRGTP